jgi:hypothetical protein
MVGGAMALMLDLVGNSLQIDMKIGPSVIMEPLGGLLGRLF